MRKTGVRNAEQEGAVVYIGPSFYGTIQKNSAFSGGFSPKISELIKKYPYLNGLFVPAGELAEARKELRRPGSEKFMLYQKAEREG